MIDHSDLAQASKLSNLWHWLKGTWTDRIILLISLLSIMISWQWIQQNLLSGTPMVHIYHAKTLLAKYPLHDSKTIHFQAQGDIGISEIIIDQHGVRIQHSPCVNQRCTLSGHRHHIGDILACVPNKILVSIQGQSQQALDAISE
ncbi:MAG: NusG domain II-containing protein [Mariprofundaceae bacterium]